MQQKTMQHAIIVNTAYTIVPVINGAEEPPTAAADKSGVHIILKSEKGEQNWNYETYYQ